MNYWLMKSEPNTFSFEDLRQAQRQTDHWDGVRNYQARNFMRDKMKKGDQVLFYHSNCQVPGVVGVAEIDREAYPDHTARDKKSPYFDPKATEQNPRWYMVNVKAKKSLKRVVSLKEIKNHPQLQKMLVAQKGQRLSIQPVEKKHFDKLLELGMAPAPKS